jgi:Ribonuclease G/E
VTQRRRLYLDRSPGEVRAVVTLDGRPERLLIVRDDDPPNQRLGARLVARVAHIDRTMASAFLDLGDGPQGLAPLKPGVSEGAAVEVEIVTEARSGKGPLVQLLGFADGPPRLLAPAQTLADRLAGFAPNEAMTVGLEARDVADAAEDAALAVEHALPGGGSIAVESTRALTAIDVDLGSRKGDPRRAARAANLAAVAEAARVLRLKGLGGLVVVDLIGRGHDGAALAAAARTALAPDEPGVSIGPVSRFGAFELVLPRRGRPVAEILCEASGARSVQSRGLQLLRALERAALTDPGARLVARARGDVVQAAQPLLSALVERFGARVRLAIDPTVADGGFEIDII